MKAREVCALASREPPELQVTVIGEWTQRHSETYIEHIVRHIERVRRAEWDWEQVPLNHRPTNGATGYSPQNDLTEYVDECKIHGRELKILFQCKSQTNGNVGTQSHGSVDEVSL